MLSALKKKRVGQQIGAPQILFSIQSTSYLLTRATTETRDNTAGKVVLHTTYIPGTVTAVVAGSPVLRQRQRGKSMPTYSSSRPSEEDPLFIDLHVPQEVRISHESSVLDTWYL